MTPSQIIFLMYAVLTPLVVMGAVAATAIMLSNPPDPVVIILGMCIVLAAMAFVAIVVWAILIHMAIANGGGGGGGRLGATAPSAQSDGSGGSGGSGR